MVSFQSLAAPTVSSIQLEASSSNCLALPFQGSQQWVSSGLLYTTPDFHPLSASILHHPRAPKVNQPFQPPLGRLFWWSQHQSSPSTEPKENYCEPFLKYHRAQDDWFWVPVSMKRPQCQEAGKRASATLCLNGPRSRLAIKMWLQ